MPMLMRSEIQYHPHMEAQRKAVVTAVTSTVITVCFEGMWLTLPELEELVKVAEGFLATILLFWLRPLVSNSPNLRGDGHVTRVQAFLEAGRNQGFKGVVGNDLCEACRH